MDLKKSSRCNYCSCPGDKHARGVCELLVSTSAVKKVGLVMQHGVFHKLYSDTMVNGI